MGGRILISDTVDRISIDILEEKGFVVDYQPNIGKTQLLEIIENFEGLLVRSGTKVTKKVLEAATNLIAIGRVGIGVDNIDMVSAIKRGVMVINDPHSSRIAVAEMVMHLIHDFQRPLEEIYKLTDAGKWPKLTGKQLQGKRLGILGFGGIGSAVAKRAVAYEMIVTTYDSATGARRNAENMGVTVTNSIDDLFNDQDFVTLHMGGEESVGTVKKRHIVSMAHGALLINTARHIVVAEGAYFGAHIERSDISYAIDVFEIEGEGIPLLSELGESAIRTPHIAGNTEEAQYQLSKVVATQLADYLQKGHAPNALIGPKVPEDFQDYLELTQRVARLAAELYKHRPGKIEISIYSDLDKHRSEFRAAAIAGVLRGKVESRVNWVNAEKIAEEVGLEVISRKPWTTEHGREVTVDLYDSPQDDTSKWKVGVRGSLGPDGHPRSLKIGLDGHTYLTEVPLDGVLAICEFNDFKGAATSLARLATDHNLNIISIRQDTTEDRLRALYAYVIEGSEPEQAWKTLLDHGIPLYDEKNNIVKNEPVNYAAVIRFD